MRIIIFLITSISIYAQVDTTDWFPMQTGNYWEYMAWDSPPKYFSIRILGDTIMPNGKEYKVFHQKYFNISSNFTQYFRKESNRIYRYVGDSVACYEMEECYLDFEVPDSSIWLICSGWMFQNARGISLSFIDDQYFSFLNKTNEAKQFEDVYIGEDTIWTPTDGSIPMVIDKGLGAVWYFIFNDGSYYLQGAIIDGIRFGTITEVNEINSIVPDNFILFQNYPNPFNPTTTISFNIPETDFVQLKVFDMLGEVVAMLVNEFKSPGNYSVNFNAADLPSGVYIYSLRVNGQVQNCKMLMIK